MSTKKTAVVTGGSRGLGREMILNLAENNFDIIFSYHSNKAKAEEVINEVKALGSEAVAFPFDANNLENTTSFIQAITAYQKEKKGTPNFDFLINNAGTGTYNLIADTTESQFDEMLHVHLKSVYFLTQKALPFLNDSGRIINISSGLTRFSLPGMSAYAIMKSAIETFTKYLAKELGERKITANVVAPGAIATDFAGGTNRDNLEKRAIIENLTALGRVGETEDVGGVVAFLCSEKARWINGQRIEVSGGMLL
ncbi:SDR family oxidoreductase [uncultured Tenacibaculum sp.]|uniref:SDR family NAD(P)-dependent oxidoreductase n=1 Tax=uncultured Tenacibaculum sp. TaxID=174713 RepID=UPI00261C44F2|nr:SDR family oxidoreductase [uncultured Tenacibaculum sp.]